jgi:peroxiredoxin
MTAQPPLAIGDPAPDVTLRDHEDHLVALRDLWQSAPLAIFFQRHLG